METHRILVNRFLPKVLILSMVTLSTLFTTAFPALAYDQNETHPALTRAMGEFLNKQGGNALSTRDIQLLAQGSVDEDKPLRFLNHFYDPIKNRGLWGMYASSKRWAQAPFDQAGTLRSAAQVMTVSANQTWQKALYEYAKGNREQAMYALGHVLHLIADATVPEHVRNDSHSGAPGDPKSPLEDWAKGENLQQAIRNVLASRGSAPTFRTLDDAFDQTALYTNRNFFSAETVGQGYDLPSPVRFDREGDWIIAYGTDEDNKAYRLAAAFSMDNEDYDLNLKATLMQPQFPQDFSIDFDPVKSDYWSRLSRKAIVNGAGVIELFLLQAEELKELADIDPRVLTAMNTSAANESAAGFVKRIFGYVLALVAPGTATPSPAPVAVAVVVSPSPSPLPRISPSPSPLPPVDSFFDVFVPLTPLAPSVQDSASGGGDAGTEQQPAGSNGPRLATAVPSPSPVSEQGQSQESGIEGGSEPEPGSETDELDGGEEDEWEEEISEEEEEEEEESESQYSLRNIRWTTDPSGNVHSRIAFEYWEYPFFQNNAHCQAAGFFLNTDPPEAFAVLQGISWRFPDALPPHLLFQIWGPGKHGFFIATTWDSFNPNGNNPCQYLVYGWDDLPHIADPGSSPPWNMGFGVEGLSDGSRPVVDPVDPPYITVGYYGWRVGVGGFWLIAADPKRYYFRAGD